MQLPKENISDGPEGIILESILEGFAEYYSAELSQKIQRGHHDNALKAKNNGGYTPLGYVVDPAEHALAIDPITAPLVREIYDRYDKGDRITDICESFRQRGIKTKRGTEFTMGTLNRVLTNRRYIGEYKYDDVVIPDGIPAIIEKDQFERVQYRMEANKRAPARAKAQEEYLLTTKLFCGDCGRIMAGESGKNGKGVIYHYYKCGGAKRKLGCKRKAVKKDWIEEAVVRITVSKVLTDEAIDRIADAILEIQNEGDTLTPTLHQQLKECEKGIENLINAIQMGILTSSTKDRLEALEKQRETLKLSLLQAQMERPKYSKEYIVSWISRFKYGNIHNQAYRKEIIDIFVNSVYLYDDHLVFTYNFKDGTQTLTLQEIESALCSDLTSSASPRKMLEISRFQAFFVFKYRLQVSQRIISGTSVIMPHLLVICDQ
ncbi:MAG: recombinase family protein [Ruminococcaceae bacterium]|nr:recombinase family protein [Oscillospiraceae bacterium]